ncbi:MAG: hypothetical protein LBC70_07055 [Chitinispirillales bacterium]|jgi:hypothetical protein|nr:hypothetical protein [Chitinispirillales bacterium]
MTQLKLLESILDKTSHIRGGLAARDMDIVETAIGERDDLIASYAGGKFGALSAECAKIAAQITAMDAENQCALKAQMDECNESLFEARRKIKELQTGKKATNQYYGAAASNRGAVFDFMK